MSRTRAASSVASANGSGLEVGNSATATITSSTLTAVEGIALRVHATTNPVSVSDSLIESSGTEDLPSGNASAGCDGWPAIEAGSTGTLTLTGDTVYNATTSDGANGQPPADALALEPAGAGAAVVAHNTIFEAAAAGNGGWDIHANGFPVTADHSSYLTTDAVNGGTITAPNTSGNIADDPQFGAASGGDFSLASGSPEIGAGDPSVVTGGETDANGAPRATSCPGGVTVLNIGALESPSPSCPVQTYSLTVSKAGTGSGTVTSGDGTHSCGSACSHSYPAGTPVTLTATAVSGSAFGGWSGGGCSGTGACQVTISQAQSVTATFNTQGTGTLPVVSGLSPPVGIPVVSGLSPAVGIPGGGNVVTIVGTHLTGASVVDFGANPASAVKVINDGEVMATSPAGSGTVDVTVKTPAGTSAVNGGDRFTYIRPAVIGTANNVLTAAVSQLSQLNPAAALKSGTFVVEVKVSTPGTINVSVLAQQNATIARVLKKGTVLAHGRAVAKHVGTVKLVLHLTSAGRAALKKLKRALPVTVVARFVPSSGAAYTAKRGARIRPRHHASVVRGHVLAATSHSR